MGGVVVQYHVQQLLGIRLSVLCLDWLRLPPGCVGLLATLASWLRSLVARKYLMSKVLRLRCAIVDGGNGSSILSVLCLPGCACLLAALASQLYSPGRACLQAALTIGYRRILMGYN